MAIEKNLEYFWRIHQSLVAAERTDAAAALVEIAVDHAYLSGQAGRHGYSLPARELQGESAKILGTLREAERYGRDERFSEESFKALLRLVYRKSARAPESPEQQ